MKSDRIGRPTTEEMKESLAQHLDVSPSEIENAYPSSQSPIYLTNHFNNIAENKDHAFHMFVGAVIWSGLAAFAYAIRDGDSARTMIAAGSAVVAAGFALAGRSARTKQGIAETVVRDNIVQANQPAP